MHESEDSERMSNHANSLTLTGAVVWLSEHRLFLVALIAYVAIYVLLMPRFVVLRGDDFGYLEGLVRSIRGNSVILGEWPGPYNVMVTLIGMAVYAMSDNFYAASLGVLASFALLNFILIHSVLSRFFQAIPSILITLLFCTLPPYLNKSLEYTGVIPSITLLLIALMLYARDRYFLMTLVVIAAYSVRQSAIVLLLLLVYRYYQSLVAGKPLHRLLSYIFLFVSAIVLIRSSLNIHTAYSQVHIIDKAFANMNLLSFCRSIAVGVLVVISIKFSIDFMFCMTPVETLRNNLSRPLAPATLSVILMTLLYYDRGLFINYETPFLRFLSPLVVVYIAFTLWFCNYNNLSKSYSQIIVSAAYVGLASIVGIWWDYYFLDLIVFIAFLSLIEHGAAGLNLRRWVNAVIIILVFGNLCYAYIFKALLDKNELRTMVLEQLLRKNKIAVTELSDATFGFVGWKLFDYFITHEGKTFIGLSKFLRYVERDRVVVMDGFPLAGKSGARHFDSSTQLETGMSRIGFLRVNYEVLRSSTPATGSLYPDRIMFYLNSGEYRYKPYPLDNKEWRAYVRDARP